MGKEEEKEWDNDIYGKKGTVSDEMSEKMESEHARKRGERGRKREKEGERGRKREAVKTKW
jgi:hypothetical protein